jgi:Carboxypeptidase regulatory-like domain
MGLGISLEVVRMSRDRRAFGWFKSFSYITLLVLGLFLLQNQRVLAQVDEGSITGIVQDATGAVVPGAQVTLTNTDQGITLNTTTNGAGEYTFSPVRIGHYTVSVTAAGFSKTDQQNLSVSADQHLQVNIPLKPGSTSETVQVTTAPPELQTEEGSVGQTVTGQSVNNLPLNGRNFTFLAQLGAGVNTPQADTRGNAASGAFTANGLRPSQNNYLLDGIDNNSNAVDFLNGTNFVVLPPVDAISEFKVQTADFSAQLGRSAGAVMNATIKSGTNSFHGAAWEFFRNDKLDAADWFEDFQGLPKGELRQNQFGVTGGGPIIKNKIFIFGDYEGLRRVAGNTQSGVSVPTTAERTSGFTNLQDIITGQGDGTTSTRTDALGRFIPIGTVLDPATTRAVTAGTIDPVSGISATSTGYVRDPFGSCGAGTQNFTLTACNLNQLPADRLDANAIKLLNLYPQPTGSGLTSNFGSNPNLFEHRNAFDARVDFDLTQKDQVFFRFSYVDDPQFIPGPFGGVADGGGFQEGLQTAKSDQSALAYTHVFTPSVVNVARAGYNHLHTTRFGPDGNTAGIPAQFGIQGIPQQAENGGLPSIEMSGLSTLGSNAFLPSDEVSDTIQITDDFTKIWGKHSFKMGIEYQNVKFSTLQPAYSRGDFEYNNNSSSVSYTDIPNVGGGATGRAQFLLQPIAATVPGGVDFVGGPDQVQASNISKTYDEKKYFATYFQDDWKITPNLTLNLGIRYDYFGPINETNGGQANFVPSGPPNGQPEYLIPANGKDVRDLSPSFLSLLAKDGIALVQTNKYGQGLVQTQKTNFVPRVGLAYQLDSKTVLRGGFGMFFNSFENQGYGPNIGENYPFVYNFNYLEKNLGTPSVGPISAGSPYAGCATAGPGGTATLNAGLSCVQFSPTQVNASGLGLQGLQFAYQTPLTISVNATGQRALSRTLSAQVSYVLTEGSHLQTGVSTNNVSQILPAGVSTTPYVPFPDFGNGSSYHQTVGRSNYNGLQTKLEKEFGNGLQFLVTYTWSKTFSDAGDLLNGGSTNGYRAPDVPGLGPSFDRGLANFDIRNVFHVSGYYELPFGKDKHFLNNANKLENAVIGGWAVNTIAGIQGGQPISLSCPTSTTSGTNCTDVKVPGQSQKLGLHKDGQGKLNWFGNPGAFQQPCPLGAAATPGCIPATGPSLLGGYPTSTTGPGLVKFDFSGFKNIPINERFYMQFRAEIFNILNHPTFNAPNFGGNGVTAISNSNNFTSANFGEIGSTRFAPYDSRQIQFALKLYY